MNMQQTFTTHPENWVEDKPVSASLLDIEGKLYLDMYGQYWLVVPQPCFPDADGDTKYDLQQIKLYRSTEREGAVATVSKFRGDRFWKAIDGDLVGEAFCIRESTNPIEALMKVLANVL